MKILALDIATCTGWSLPHDSGTFDMKAELEATRDWGRITYLFHGWLAGMLGEYQPDLVAIESPILRGGSAILLVGLCQTAHSVAYSHQIPRTERTPQAIKKHVTGHHVATKDKMVEAVRALGHEPKTNDAADAIALRLLVESET